MNRKWASGLAGGLVYVSYTALVSILLSGCNLGDYTGTKAPCCCVGDRDSNGHPRDPYVTDTSKCGGVCDTDTASTSCPKPTATPSNHYATKFLRDDLEGAGLKALFFAAAPENGGSCLQKCQSGRSDANCTVSTLTVDDSQAFKDLYERMTKNATFKIEPSELQNMFHVGTDPCNRGATNVSDTKVTNSGKEVCQIESRFEGPRFRLRIYMPQRLEGTWVSRSNPLRLDFKDSRKAPIFRFLKLNSDAPDVLDSEWGGRALFAESNGTEVTVRTIGGCVGAIFK